MHFKTPIYRILGLTLFLIVSFIQNISAQSISGKVMDSTNNNPLAFASIRIFKSADKKLVNGTLASDSGTFHLTLSPDEYYAIIEFMGFRSHTTNSFTLDKNNSHFNIGFIKMARLPGMLETITIQAERSSMQLSLDKKIFNVGLDLANAGGSAADILTNIPSVSVDAEGNVKLRGSDNVRILIDGKPSGLVSIKGGSGLQQLQANMIEKVEIITNPSAQHHIKERKERRFQRFPGSSCRLPGKLRRRGQPELPPPENQFLHQLRHYTQKTTRPRFAVPGGYRERHHLPVETTKPGNVHGLQ